MKAFKPARIALFFVLGLLASQAAWAALVSDQTIVARLSYRDQIVLFEDLKAPNPRGEYGTNGNPLMPNSAIAGQNIFCSLEGASRVRAGTYPLARYEFFTNEGEYLGVLGDQRGDIERIDQFVAEFKAQNGNLVRISCTFLSDPNHYSLRPIYRSSYWRNLEPTVGRARQVFGWKIGFDKQ